MRLSRRTVSVSLISLAAAAAISLSITGRAEAATSTVLLHTQTSIPQLLTDDPSGVTSMSSAPLGGTPRQQWRKTDTELGYATYKSVQSINDGSPRCLTGRGLQGFPLVTAEKCVSGARNQQWRLSATGEFKLRLNGLVAAHQTGGSGIRVIMQFFVGAPNQKWHTHDA